MKKTGLLAVVAAAAIALTSCGTGNLSKTAMEIGDTKVTLGDLAVVTDVMSGGADFDTAKTSFAEQIELSFKFGELGKAMGIELTDEEKDMAVQQRASWAQQNGGYSAFKKYLKANGSSIEFIEKLFGETMYQSGVMEKIDEMLEGVEATEEEVLATYQDTFLCAKHILIEFGEDKAAAEKLANEILERAKNGEDFDAMAQEYSTDPGLESNPQGYVFTDGEMVKPFEDGVKALKSGEFGICETTYGYHVLLRQDLPELTDEMRETVTKKVNNQREDKKIEELCEQYGIKVVVNDDVIASLTKDMMKKPLEVADETTPVQ